MSKRSINVLIYHSHKLLDFIQRLGININLQVRRVVPKMKLETTLRSRSAHKTLQLL
jgi:hypothetical protein